MAYVHVVSCHRTTVSTLIVRPRGAKITPRRKFSSPKLVSGLPPREHLPYRAKPTRLLQWAERGVGREDLLPIWHMNF